MKEDHVILGIHVTNRLRNASEVQKVFTEYGCNIKTRLGLHEVADNYCAGEGVVLLEIIGGAEIRKGMLAKLGAIEGLEAKEMVFSHE
ncbi:MAG TPA: hypothetical protein VN436_01700 [Holophaga sp.]|nr:hypothetical protein [Holophaga sp.]